MIQQREGAAVQRTVGHNVLAGAGDGPQGRGNGAHTGSGCHAGLAALQRRHFILQNGDGGVAQSGIDVTGFLSGKAPSALLAAVKNKGGGLIDGGRQRTVLCVLHITGVDGFGTKTNVGVHHNSSSCIKKFVDYSLFLKISPLQNVSHLPSHVVFLKVDAWLSVLFISNYSVLTGYPGHLPTYCFLFLEAKQNSRISTAVFGKKRYSNNR